MTEKKVTIKDVAKASGVSIATVSQIVNGNSKNFSPKTVAKVLKIKDELNYVPDYFARRMVMKKSKTIGVLVPDISNPFFSTLVRGVEDVLYKENFITMLCNANGDNEKESLVLEELSRRGVDGFIIASSAISDEDIERLLINKKHPFIILDQKSSEENSDSIQTDDFLGGNLAASHLKELGHEKVAVVLPEKATANIVRRLEGFIEVMGKNVTVIYSSLSKEGGRRAAKDIITTDVTGIFAINDEIAFGLYLGLKDFDKSIPSDYSVIGYDNVDMCKYVTPPLTTIAQPIYELGQQTAELLLERIEHPEQEKVVKKLPVNLINRFSTRQI
ncbi:LacI family DNA-binding transcriptional regulator [Vagococcus carniphilus]|uniref:LacI family DNA-binding transcriptional regulator n=1 Tax=Vagococcus carniphilus TaxID=218144 RepID=A0AAW8U2X0_9ENTE|nr:LacI family DNA-binding transcriptional regulator [Vagococcus carniphilus]MDT2830464.1 LacI family DNA-binding transcriptional regulator [Vagococcus carniphilus]MDT2832500.1 LacI family DNA-binding transcriptional regulator [Vagococcus carniphilus]MDT2839967.1 LacI family DNA-binding transcriptional regulator [Vagococcus carniphilus]MDT2854458.1 LacI family DNA-binding transcriptional regulator [Vagococcus carniphilus]